MKTLCIFVALVISIVSASYSSFGYSGRYGFGFGYPSYSSIFGASKYRRYNYPSYSFSPLRYGYRYTYPFSYKSYTAPLLAYKKYSPSIQKSYSGYGLGGINYGFGRYHFGGSRWGLGFGHGHSPYYNVFYKKYY